MTGFFKKKKINLNFIFTLLCGALKGFMPFEAPQRSVKIKISTNFYFNTTS